LKVVCDFLAAFFGMIFLAVFLVVSFFGATFVDFLPDFLAAAAFFAFWLLSQRSS
jgi:hypothetical protein